MCFPNQKLTTYRTPTTFPPPSNPKSKKTTKPDTATAIATSLTQQTETQAMLSVTTGFLSALSSKSREDFDVYCVRAGGMALFPPSPAIPRFCTIGSFVEQISKLRDEIDERIWDPEITVSGDGGMGFVWAPFRARVNGVLDHVGVELFVLHKIGGEWKVTGMADSCRVPTEEERVSLN